MDSLGGLLEIHSLSLLGVDVLQHRLVTKCDLGNRSNMISYLVHAAGELLVIIIDLGLGFVPDDGSPHVQHGFANDKQISLNF